MNAEFGAPQWVFGTTTYGFQPDGTIIARYAQGGTWRLMRLNPRTGKLLPIPIPNSNISSVNVAHNRTFCIAGSPTEPESLIEIDVPTGKTQVVRRSSSAGNGSAGRP